MGNRHNFIKFRSYFALLKPNTDRRLQKRCKCSWKSCNWFFVSKAIELRARFFITIILTGVKPSRVLPSIMKLQEFLQLAAQFTSYRCLDIQKKFNLFFAFRRQSPRAPMRSATRWWRSELWRKIGSLTKFEEMDTDIGTCFPIKIFVFVSFKVFSWTQIDSGAKNDKFLKSFCQLECLIPKESSLSKSFSGIWSTILG